MKVVRFYEAQGMTPVPGYDTFILGNLARVQTFLNKDTTKPPLRNIVYWLAD